jgi:hypothetical protein
MQHTDYDGSEEALQAELEEFKKMLKGPKKK